MAPRSRSNILTLKFIIDTLVWTAAAPAAFLLRVAHPLQYGRAILFYTALGFPFKLGLIWAKGLFRHTWRRTSLNDLFDILWVTAILGLVMGGLTWLWRAFGLGGIAFALPRSIPLLEAALGILFLGGARFVTRGMEERYLRRYTHAPSDTKKVLIAGAGEGGTLLAREIQHHPEMHITLVGFVDNNASRTGSRVLGLPVLGTLADLPAVVKHYGVEEVLIAMPKAPGKTVRQVIDLCNQAGVPYRIMPALHEILTGKVLVSQIRPVKLEDLLRREPVTLDMHSIAAYLTGKNVLITGAGGSIGAEIVRQVLRFHPKRVILLGRGEYSIYQISKEIRSNWPEQNFVSVIADLRNTPRLRRVMREYQPQVIFHAAAHKHVPLMEAQPDEAVLNNVIGTWNLVQAAQEAGVERFVNISTDKAVNPTSVMGATKRVSEFIVQAAAAEAKPHQVFVSVRFGNVLGSRGSVVPLFQEQIRRGGPITITHPEMRRYFMTIPEAAQLVLQAAGIGQNGAVYVLDMGEMVKIVDLAKDLIRLSGYHEDEIPIVFTGLRPGEKLYEELLTAEEGVESTRHQQIFIAKVQPVDKDWLEKHLQRLRAAAETGDDNAIRRLFLAMIPTYTPWNGNARSLSAVKMIEPDAASEEG